MSVINKGSEGPDLVNILKIPKKIQQVLQSIRKPTFAILEELKTIETYNRHKQQTNEIQTVA